MAEIPFTPNVYTKTIWDNLLSYIGNEIGVAGMMGNLYYESQCYPYKVYGDNDIPPSSISTNYTNRVDIHDISREEFISSKAYGLAQWLYKSRKENLYDAPWGGGQPSSGNSIGSLTRGLIMINWELNHDYSSVLNILQSTQDIDYATERVYTLYEQLDDGTLGYRRKLATDIYNFYSSGTGNYYILITTSGNGSATVVPSFANAGDIITLTCTPAVGEILEDIIATEMSSGQSIALSVQTGSQTFPMVAENVSIYVQFSGTTPVPPIPPPTPSKTTNAMPIWMYPSIRRV